MPDPEKEAAKQAEEDRRKAKNQVHARYTGGTDIVFPHLQGAPRCCNKENLPSPDEGLDHVLVGKGDVFLINQYSAEARDDLEVVDEPKAKTSKEA